MIISDSIGLGQPAAYRSHMPHNCTSALVRRIDLHGKPDLSSYEKPRQNKPCRCISGHGH
ncbi:MAG: hypothetical protein PUH50_01920 [Firmicutes bacterium]|nr:hypothetical protein [Bacillota bacterium]MDD7284724.1 hypothetical protein [Bacillota bacterium]